MHPFLNPSADTVRKEYLLISILIGEVFCQSDFLAERCLQNGVSSGFMKDFIKDLVFFYMAEQALKYIPWFCIRI